MVPIMLAGSMLAGCSDIYFDRRETVALGADDHIAVNRVAQMIDPWPRDSAKRAIAYNGQKMQSAAERYRTGRVIAPVNITTSSTAYQDAQKSAASALDAANPPTLSAPAAPVK
jgi:ABC-type glutathione transport system ATPase component